MSDLTDELVSSFLRSDPEVRQAYRYDATFHAEVTLLRRAAGRAHAALLAQGDPQADDIARALVTVRPDLKAALRRIDDRKSLTFTGGTL